MRRREFLSLGLLLGPSLLWPAAAHATAAGLVDPTYDAASKTLSVKIRHWSLFDSLHYMKTVEVKVNGTVASTNQYTSQPGSEYTYKYPLAANPGDVVDVTATCSWWGSKTVGLTIPKVAAAEQPPRTDDAAKAEPGAKPEK